MESWLHVVSHECNQKSYFSSEQSENELWSQNDIQKMSLREKIDFFKSLFQKFLEMICIKAQLVCIHKGPHILEQFKFKWSDNYKCLNLRSKVKNTLSWDPLTALCHHLWYCSNDMFKFSNCSYERSWNQLSRKKINL